VNANGGLAYDRYHTSGADEWLMRIGAADAPPILFLPPLLEEMNRTRALLAATMRDLAERGFGCWLPDLPGTGESERALDDCGWQDWTAAAADAADHVERIAGRRPAIAAVRGGCLLDAAVDAPCRWRFAPAEGASLARDLERSSLIAPDQQAGGAVILAGYPLSAAMREELKARSPVPVSPLRTLRLQSDRAEADHKLDGPALWRRSEPGHSPELAGGLAADLAAWIDRCGAC
jgi:pimeloyl-ACP methyl ester carboxylesterase